MSERAGFISQTRGARRSRSVEEVGSGITRRRTFVGPDIPINPAEAEDFMGYLHWHEQLANQPFGRYRATVEAVLAEFEKLVAQDADREEAEPGFMASKAQSDQYLPYESPAWYIKAMAKLSGAMRADMAAGRPWAAVANAIEFGELLSELDLKGEYESDFLRAKANADARAAANRKRKGRSAEERLDAVEIELERNGGTREDAYQTVADQEFKQKSTIKADCLTVAKNRRQKVDGTTD